MRKVKMNYALIYTFRPVCQNPMENIRKHIKMILNMFRHIIGLKTLMKGQ